MSNMNDEDPMDLNFNIQLERTTEPDKKGTGSEDYEKDSQTRPSSS